jgi:uncharacterized protein YehS (DUF1456 family)
MTNNDYLRALRHVMNIPDSRVVELIELTGYLVTPEEVASYLKIEGEPGHEPCPHEVMSHFLNGMVLFKRGRDESRPLPTAEVPVSNNLVLKKLRVAFELKDTDIIALVEKSGTLKVTKSELGAFFRSRDHRNYRECGDQFLRHVFRSLSL